MNTRRMINLAALFALVLSSLATTAALQGPSPFVGEWQAVDADGSDIRLSIGGPPGGPFHITWTESYITLCGGEAGILRGSGELQEDPNLLEADLTVECFTTGESTALHLWITYHPGTGTLSSVYPSGLRVVFTRPGKPRGAYPPLQLRANYQEDWVEGFYPEGHTVWIAVTEGDGRTVKGTAKMVTGPVPFWDGEIGFSTLLTDWDPGQPEIEPNDWVYGWVDNGATARMQIGEIIPDVDLKNNLVEGTIAADWYDEDVFVICTVWGYEGEWLQDTVLPNGTDTFSCDFEGLWDIVPGDTAEVWYYGPDGHALGHYIPIPIPPAIQLRVNYGHDWVESFYEEPFVGFLITIKREDSTVATAVVSTDESGYFQTKPEDWEGTFEDLLQPGDLVLAEASNGAEAEVWLGDIQGEVDVGSDSITGTIMADWIDGEVQVECLDWGSGGDAGNQNGGSILPDGAHTYNCAWDPSDWDIQPWQEIGVGYFTPDGHWVANAFRAEHWMGTWIYDLPDGLPEEPHNYHFDSSYTIPDPGGTGRSPDEGELVLVVSTDAGPYEGYVLVGPWPAMSPRAWTGSGCDVVSQILPGQPIRFIWGWVNDDSMNYEDALSHFNSFRVDVSWDGGSSGSETLQRVDELPEFYSREQRFNYMCGFTEPLEEP